MKLSNNISFVFSWVQTHPIILWNKLRRLNKKENFFKKTAVNEKHDKTKQSTFVLSEYQTKIIESDNIPENLIQKNYLNCKYLSNILF